MRDSLSITTLGHRAWCCSVSRGCPRAQRARHPAGGGDRPRKKLREALPQGCGHVAIGATVVPRDEEWFATANAGSRGEPQIADLRRDIAPVPEDILRRGYGEFRVLSNFRVSKNAHLECFNRTSCRHDGSRVLGKIFFNSACFFISCKYPQRELAPFFAVDVVVLRRDPAASLKSRVELGHLCGRNKQSDWLLLPPRDHLRPFTAAAANSSHWCQGNRSEDAQEVDMDGFEALMAYATYTEANIR